MIHTFHALNLKELLIDIIYRNLVLKKSRSVYVEVCPPSAFGARTG